MTARPTRTLAALAGLVLPLGLLVGGGSPAYGAPVALSPCVNPDNTRPVVTHVSLSTTATDTTRGPDAVDVTVAATDTGGPGAASGVASITVQLVGPAGNFAPEDPVTMTDGGAGTWTAHLVLPRGISFGTYRPALTITDGAGNYRSYGTGAEDVPGNPELGNTSIQDRTPPRLGRVSLSTTKVDTRRRAATVVVKAHALDARAGVKRILVTASVDRRRSVSAFLQRTSGTANDGVWRGTMRIPRYMGNATWKLRRIAVVDGVINVRSYSYHALGVLGLRHHVDRAVKVRSGADNAQPTASPVTFSVPTVDVTAADQQVIVRVAARDDASGVAALRVRLLDDDTSDGVLDTELTRVSGTTRNGVWQATVTIPRCGSVGGLWTAQLKVTDAAGRIRQIFAGQPTLSVISRDNLVPRVVRTYVSGAPVLTFSEDVTGITPTSAQVYDSAGTDVPGAWTCTDATGAAAACAVGTVRTATYVPAPSFAPTGQLYVELNPDGSLGVTDLAGNPVGRRYVV
jgi:serine protease